MNRKLIGSALLAIVALVPLAGCSDDDDNPLRPEAATARVQVIHNAADPAAASVDIWIDDEKAIDNFAFRAATPYLDLPAGVEFVIGVAPSTSTSADDALATFPVTLAEDGTYVVIANGVLAPAEFEANPNSRATGFTLLVKDMAREASSTAGQVQFFALHGATDAPIVDVIARGVATLVADAGYADMTGYVTVPPGSYTLDVTPGSDNATVVASFTADLSGLGGGAAVVFASGFLSPVNDKNGPGFGLFAALPNGTVVAFPAI